MGTPFVLVPGAGGMAWYWHRVAELLALEQRQVIAMDLPADDDRARLRDYADAVVRAIGAQDAVLVAQSLGGFTAPLVCARARIRALVLVNAMIPLPAERVGAWWENTGATQARVAAAERTGYSSEFEDWPPIPIHVLASKDDRFFPVDFQERVARERLGKAAEMRPGGHLVALSNPQGIVESLLRFDRSA